MVRRPQLEETDMENVETDGLVPLCKIRIFLNFSIFTRLGLIFRVRVYMQINFLIRLLIGPNTFTPSWLSRGQNRAFCLVKSFFNDMLIICIAL